MIHLEEKLDKKRLEKAVLIGVWHRDQPKDKTKEYLDELTELSNTAGAKVIGKFVQRLERPNPRTFIGTGKLEEIGEFVKSNDADLVIFDDDLSPSQVRNIDKILGVKVLDRSGIILHIFSERARTAQATAQVELAQLQYMLPRLAGLWTHLSKQKGGIGLKGAGEKEIETDRRMIRHKIDILKAKLAKIDKQNETRRRNRRDMIRVSLIGYTNAGKSTLMNALSKSDVLSEDKLFATLDTTVRKVVLGRMPFLLSDTVGFIRKLPHDLVECFKSTLDETRESDVLLHVVDVSHPAFEDHIRVVKRTLEEIGAQDKKVIYVFNKVDLLSPEDRKDIEDTWMAKENVPAVFISAYQKVNLNGLRQVLMTEINKLYGNRYPDLGLNGEMAQWNEWLNLQQVKMSDADFGEKEQK